MTYLNPSSGLVNSSTSGILLTNIPNYLSTLEINFTHTSAIRCQNPKLYIYDRSSINNPASGVTTKIAEIIHPALLQTATGSGSQVWQTPSASSYVALTPSPGQSGTAINGNMTTQNTHSWYIAASASPDSIGSKTLYGLYFSVEYL